jgi:intergrase/recombinase
MQNLEGTLKKKKLDLKYKKVKNKIKSTKTNFVKIRHARKFKSNSLMKKF